MELEKHVREAADDFVAAGQPGVVVGAIAGDDTAIAGVGDDAPDAHTLFEIGSVTKTFTSLALFNRTRAGEVAYDQRLAELLPAGRRVPERDGRAITLVDLATHTSGLPRLPKGAMPRVLFDKRDPYARFTADKVLAGLARTRLRSVPGTTVTYSNLGVGLLGLALARQAGTDYATLIAREITEPLGMTDTVVTVDPTRAARLARGHTKSGKPAAPWTFDALAGAGALRSTAADMIVFLRAHLGTGIGAEALRAGDASRRPTPDGTWMQPGWVGAGKEVPFYLHDGGTGGFSSFIGLFPGRRAGVVVLANSAADVSEAGLRFLGTVARLTA
ncbi:serine hydrolase domain-containing protein [Embleya sp. NBC_00896]|uniref:serine hydrolase domain-containing protein n=1 Tax=Embleya sp. NBC_00896 TaxID=2975961 RepID=UPI003864299F|nr:serine hydrolase [Embleya sp. NBC_00896]